jgi:hypothetical protein
MAARKAARAGVAAQSHQHQHSQGMAKVEADHNDERGEVLVGTLSGIFEQIQIFICAYHTNKSHSHNVLYVEREEVRPLRSIGVFSELFFQLQDAIDR